MPIKKINNGAPPSGAEPPQAPPRRPLRRSAITHDTVVCERAQRPESGWRRAVHDLSAGRLTPALSRAEAERTRLHRRICRHLPGAHRITVASLKGGVGKTTVTACLGLTLAEYRGDRVMALDANPDAGTLADRLTGETGTGVRELLDNAHRIDSSTELSRFTSLAGRLQVLASDQDPERSEAFGRDDYALVSHLLCRFCNIVLTDSGTGLVHSAMAGTLAHTDTLIVVGSPTVDGASRAATTLDWLAARGHPVSDAIVVLSCDRASPQVDDSWIESHFARRCRAVHRIPPDPHLRSGGRVRLDALGEPTRRAFVELAATVADGFWSAPSASTRTRPPVVRRPRGSQPGTPVHRPLGELDRTAHVLGHRIAC